MSVDYSKWDNLVLTDSDEESDNCLENKLLVNEGLLADATLGKRDFGKSGTVHKLKENSTVTIPKNKKSSYNIYKEYIWKQSLEEVEFWIQLPTQYIKGSLNCSLITEPDSNQVPIGIADLDLGYDDDDDMDKTKYKSGYGIRVTFKSRDYDDDSSLFFKKEGGLLSMEERFPFPIFATESLWNWTIESKCPPLHHPPLLHTKDFYLYVTVRKKTLQRVTVTWNALFIGRDKITTTSASSENFSIIGGDHDDDDKKKLEWQKTWEKAHDLFKQKVALSKINDL